MKKLYGLVVCGGKSSRMGTDKGMLEYFGEPQRYHLYKLLEPICDKVFISCNKHQAVDIPNEYKKITDHEDYENIGPMASLLSAFKLYPDADFILLACDYPFINRTDMQQLADSRSNDQKAAVFFNPETGYSEPLLGIYQATCYKALMEEFNSNNYSLRFFLEKVNACKIAPRLPETIISIDTPEAYKNALEKIKSKTI